MKMKPTTTGIDWNRVRPEKVDGLAAATMHAAKNCSNRNAEREVRWSRYAHDHYTSIGGETVCLDAGRGYLLAPYAAGVLADSLGTRFSDHFDAHVAIAEARIDIVEVSLFDEETVVDRSFMPTEEAFQAAKNLRAFYEDFRNPAVEIHVTVLANA